MVFYTEDEMKLWLINNLRGSVSVINNMKNK